LENRHIYSDGVLLHLTTVLLLDGNGYNIYKLYLRRGTLTIPLVIPMNEARIFCDSMLVNFNG